MLLFIPQILVALLSLLPHNIIEKQCSDVTKLTSCSSHFGERKLRKKILFTWDIAIYLLLNITVSRKWFFLNSWDFKICFVFSIFCIKIVWNRLNWQKISILPPIEQEAGLHWSVWLRVPIFNISTLSQTISSKIVLYIIIVKLWRELSCFLFWYLL